MSDITDLIERLEEAREGSRELDWAIAYWLGLGTENERAVWEEHGPKGFTDRSFHPDRFTALEKKNGAWMRYSRPKRGGGRTRVPPERVHVVTGPQPLSRCPTYTTSLDAALTLVPEGYGAVSASINERGASSMRIGHPYVFGNAATPALALCIAALKARESQ